MRAVVFGITLLSLVLISMFDCFHGEKQILAPPETFNNTKFNLCLNVEEAFSGAYIITKAKLLSKYVAFNLSNVNCEKAVFMVSTRTKLLQTTDVLDFSVINLSTYERSLYMYIEGISKEKVKESVFPTIAQTVLTLKNHVIHSQAQQMQQTPVVLAHNANKIYTEQTVVVMPILLSTMGASYSEPMNRKLYLSACFWSFYATYKNIIGFVTNTEDLYYIKYESGLPFKLLLQLNYIPKTESLPVATIQYTRQMIKEGKWNYQYVFYTEADQILLFRNPSDVYAQLQAYPKHTVSPHRLTTYPEKVLKDVFHREYPEYLTKHWTEQSCCIPRQDCSDRSKWAHIGNNLTGPSILNIYGLQVGLGNTDFHKAMFRTCELTDYKQLCD